MMIKAVIFDMFETLASLFEGKTYFSEDMARDIGVEHGIFRKAWHKTEDGRTTGLYTIEQAVAIVLKEVGAYSGENVAMLAKKRLENLEGTFRADISPSVLMLEKLRENGFKTGLISNCYSDECEMIKKSPLYKLIDVPVLSYECGLCKPDEKVFMLAAERLGVSPKECLYVGDGGSDELVTARRIGMKPLQALYYHHLAFEPHIPCGVLDDVEHLYDRSKLFEHII